MSNTTFSLSNIFLNSQKNSKRKCSLLIDQEIQEQDIKYIQPTNVLNIQQTLVLPAITKNFKHKKLCSESTKRQNSQKIKDALKEWLIGKNDMVIETFIKDKNVKKDQMNNLEQICPNESVSPQVVFKSKRRTIKPKILSNDGYESRQLQRINSLTNHVSFEQNSQSIQNQSQSISLPQALDNINQINSVTENYEIVNNRRSNPHCIYKKQSFDILDDLSSIHSSFHPIETNFNQKQDIKSSQQIYSKNNQKEIGNFFSASSSQKHILFNNNPIQTNGVSQNQVRNNPPSISSGNTSPQIFGSETKIQLPTSIKFIQQVPRYLSLQNIPINLSLLKETFRNDNVNTPAVEQSSTMQNGSIFSINLSRDNLKSRYKNRNYVAQSMGSIPLPLNIKIQTKSILKDQIRERSFPKCKKNVIFSEKTIKFEI